MQTRGMSVRQPKTGDDPPTKAAADKPLRVCLSSLYAYPLFDSRDTTPIGGAETHAWLLARGFTEYCRLQVDFVVPGHIDEIERNLQVSSDVSTS